MKKKTTEDSINRGIKIFNKLDESLARMDMMNEILTRIIAGTAADDFGVHEESFHAGLRMIPDRIFAEASRKFSDAGEAFTEAQPWAQALKKIK